MSQRTASPQGRGRRWWTLLTVAIVIAALREIAFARNAARRDNANAPTPAPPTDQG